MLRKYFWNLLIAIDQLFNAILLGDPDQTISGRLGNYLEYNTSTWQYKIANVICWFLRKLDKNHCKKSIEIDEGKDRII